MSGTATLKEHAKHHLSAMIFSSAYLFILIAVAPAIDHLFIDLEQDRARGYGNPRILIEIMIHIFILLFVWFYIDRILTWGLSKINIQSTNDIKTCIRIICALALVGLQKNLINKLRYITIEHPFRILS